MQPDTPTEKWTYEVSEPRPGLLAFERGDRNNAIYLRFWIRTENKNGGLYRKVKLAETVRYTTADEKAADGRKKIRAGNINPVLESALKLRVADIHRRWIRDRIDPGEQLRREREPAVEEAPPTEEAPPPQDLTVEAGFEAILHPDTGKYPGQLEAKNRREYRRLVKEIEKHLHHLDSPQLTWAELTILHLEMIWRGISADRRNSGRGYRWAERAAGFLISTGNWLEERRDLPAGTVKFPRKWRATFKTDWERLTHRAVPDYGTEDEGPRYEPAEAAALLKSLDDPETDPRLRLHQMAGGSQLRGGQVLRSMRSQLRLGEGGNWDLGRLTVLGRGKKSGSEVDLDPELFQLFRTEMTEGYLRHLEEAFQSGEINDYALFPQGHLRNGAVPLRDNLKYRKPAGSTALRNWFLNLEERAGVTHIKGRLCHGLRRLSTDLNADLTTDARVLDKAGGWVQGSQLREGRYQQKGAEEIRRRASQLRVEARQQLGSGGANSEENNLRRSIVADLNQVTDTAVLQTIKAVIDQHLENEVGPK